MIARIDIPWNAGPLKLSAESSPKGTIMIKNYRKALIQAAIGIALIASTLMVTLAFSHNSNAEIHRVSSVTIPSCVTEDSDNCYWDSTKHGNGKGNSFITWNGVTYYAR
jgi:hypothetical protein